MQNSNSKIVVEDVTEVLTPSETAVNNEENLTQILMLVCGSAQEAVELCALVAMTISIHHPGGMANVQKLHDLIDSMTGYVQMQHADCLAETGSTH